MIVRKGQRWGEPGALPSDGLIVRSDREASLAVTAARDAGREAPALGLAGGDLCRTLGGGAHPERLHSDAAMRFPLDLGWVMVDTTVHRFVAHAIARRSWWHGRVVAAMNAEWLGRWDVAPRAHPNDGQLDLFDAHLRFDDRLKARRRLPAGLHVPHPDIGVTRAASASFSFSRPLDVWVDGERVGRTDHLEVGIEPDAFTGVV